MSLFTPKRLEERLFKIQIRKIEISRILNKLNFDKLIFHSSFGIVEFSKEEIVDKLSKTDFNLEEINSLSNLRKLFFSNVEF